MNKDDIWSSIRLFKNQLSVNFKVDEEINQNDFFQGGQKIEDKENIYKKSNALDNYNDQFRISKKQNEGLRKKNNDGENENLSNQNYFKDKTCACDVLKMKKDCAQQIKKVHLKYEQQICEINKQHDTIRQEQIQKHAGEMLSLEEDLENAQILLKQFDKKICNEAPQQNFDELLGHLRSEFELDLKNEREVFKSQLEKQIIEKIHLEKKLYSRDEQVNSLFQEIQQLKDLNSKPKVIEPKLIEPTNVSQNYASMLYRDTNRKCIFPCKRIEKIAKHNENDLSVFVEDQNSQGIAKNIKNFNDNIKLINRSIDHYI